MRTGKPSAGEPAYYTIRDAAWILGAEPPAVCAAIRAGTPRAVRRRGRLMVPASALTRLLAQPAADGRREAR